MSFALAPPPFRPAWDYWRGLLQPGWSPYGNTARIVRRAAAAADSETLMLRPFRRLAEWQPGQHLTVGFELDGRRFQRSFTLTSLPGERDFALTVRRRAGGRFADWLAQAGAGARLQISDPWGGLAFELPQAPRRLLLAAGSGITAAMAQVRAAAARGQLAGLGLAYWVRERAQACFIEELHALQARFPEFRFRLFLTGDTPVAGHEADGRLDAGTLAALPADPAGAEVLACGPQGFVARVEALLRGAAARVATESFTPPLLRLPESPVASVALTLARSGRTLSIPTGTPLLAALEAAGLNPEHGCRAGLCGRCVCAKPEGVHVDLRDGSIHPEPSRALKLCVSAARGDLAIDL
ncbi:MAG: 2Fe-2S iron-sulfur cluster binding domain-containing protein [Xanthomonadaceae bacterium]|jgi:ferredoxin-NADP reductase|nr:2Fe-2S iron-sulfur cluster binding domain-containing protein [Xanthomonadaceae bacterium]